MLKSFPVFIILLTSCAPGKNEIRLRNNQVNEVTSFNKRILWLLSQLEDSNDKRSTIRIYTPSKELDLNSFLAQALNLHAYQFHYNISKTYSIENILNQNYEKDNHVGLIAIGNLFSSISNILKSKLTPKNLKEKYRQQFLKVLLTLNESQFSIMNSLIIISTLDQLSSNKNIDHLSTFANSEIELLNHKHATYFDKFKLLLGLKPKDIMKKEIILNYRLKRKINYLITSMI